MGMGLIRSFGGRKALATFAMLLIGAGCVWLKGDVTPGFLTLMQTLFGGFVLGNGVDHFMETKKAQVLPTPTPDPTIIEAKQSIDRLVSGSEAQAQTLQTLTQAVSYIITRAGWDQKPKQE